MGVRISGWRERVVGEEDGATQGGSEWGREGGNGRVM